MTLNTRPMTLDTTHDSSTLEYYSVE